MVDREQLGREVRAEWIAWAREQPSPKPSWLVPWEDLGELDREVDRRIGERLYRMGARDLGELSATVDEVLGDIRRMLRPR